MISPPALRIRRGAAASTRRGERGRRGIRPINRRGTTKCVRVPQIVHDSSAKRRPHPGPGHTSDDPTPTHRGSPMRAFPWHLLGLGGRRVRGRRSSGAATARKKPRRRRRRRCHSAPDRRPLRLRRRTGGAPRIPRRSGRPAGDQPAPADRATGARGVRPGRRQPVRQGRGRAALDLLGRRRHGELRDRPAVPDAEHPAPEGRRPGRGADQLFHLRRPAADRRRAVLGPGRGRRLPVEPGAPARADRPGGQDDRQRQAAGEQPRLPARRLRAR